jgi:dCTP deaminase
MRVCALTFEELSSPADIPYNKKKSAKYAGQKSPEASKIAEER